MAALRVLILRSRKYVSPPARWQWNSVLEVPGSCHMRADQLRELVAPHLSANLEIEVAGVSRSRRPRAAMLRWIAGFHVVILTKRVGYSLPRSAIDDIRGTGVRLGLDHVDGSFSTIPPGLFDFHVGASIAGSAALARRFGGGPESVWHLPHHADPRIGGCNNSLDRVSAVYFGNPNHLLMPAALRDEVAILPASHQREADRNIHRLSAYNLHYAVRPSGETKSLTQFRPFTKGANAAAASANIVVQRDVVDAVAMLGEDYPYLVEDASEAAATATFRKAQASFGSPEWRYGLDIMASVRDSVHPARIAAQFTNMVTSVR